MPEAEEIRRIAGRYLQLLSDGDVDGIMSLFAEEATVEDPVGSEPRRGRPAIRDFYAATAPKLQVELTGPIRVAGNECAMPMLAGFDLGERTLYIDVIDVMKFDGEGRVVSLRAFWSATDGRPTR